VLCVLLFVAAGFFFGRTPLIKLSPKKTWEGFIGGFIGTVIVAALLADIMSRFKWMTCPRPVRRHLFNQAARGFSCTVVGCA